ncbi:MAG: hypothetical protein IJ629_03080 [Clostridia bacterium]|nr:hypothetical protein [Clostridia bacterium]
MQYLLYEYDDKAQKNIKCTENLKIIEFIPKLFKLYKDIEKKRFRTTIFRFYISILTKNKTKIYLVLDEKNRIVHTAYIICNNLKYPFIPKNSIAIGPCSTEEFARGKGIYPSILYHIVSNTNYDSYYLVIKPENIASRHGAEKAGFILTNKKIGITKLFKRFVEIKN